MGRLICRLPVWSDNWREHAPSVEQPPKHSPSPQTFSSMRTLKVKDRSKRNNVGIGFVAKSEAEVNAFYEAAMASGATDNGKPGARLYYDPRYYAANVFDPDGYSLEAVY